MIKFFYYKNVVKTIFQNFPFLTEISPNSLAAGFRSELDTEPKKEDAGNYGVRGWRSIWVILVWEVFPKTGAPATYLQASGHVSPHSRASYSSILCHRSSSPSRLNFPLKLFAGVSPNRMPAFGGQGSCLSLISLLPMYECTHCGCSVLVESD